MSKNKQWQQRQAAPDNHLANAQNDQARANTQSAADQHGALQSPPQMSEMPEPAALPPEPVSPVMPPVDGIVLFNPRIDLGEHIFIGTPPTEQVKRLTPKLAYVIHGAIVIEELNLILPLAGNLIRTSR